MFLNFTLIREKMYFSKLISAVAFPLRCSWQLGDTTFYAPGHVDIVKALVKVPSIQEMGLKKEGEQLYSKMMEATTRGLTASSGSKYFRYVCTALGNLMR